MATMGARASDGSASSCAAIKNAASPAAAQGPRGTREWQGDRDEARATAWTSVTRSSARKTAAAASPGRSEVATPSRSSRLAPATAAAAKTAAATWRPRRERIRERASPSDRHEAISPTAASSGPPVRKSPARGSRHDTRARRERRRRRERRARGRSFRAAAPGRRGRRQGRAAASRERRGPRQPRGRAASRRGRRAARRRSTRVNSTAAPAGSDRRAGLVWARAPASGRPAAASV